MVASGAMDNEVAAYLRQEHIPYFAMQAAPYSELQGAPHHPMRPATIAVAPLACSSRTSSMWADISQGGLLQHLVLMSFALAIPSGHLMKGTKAARLLAFNKIGVAQTLNTFGLDALLCDADTVWLRDPTGFFSG